MNSYISNEEDKFSRLVYEMPSYVTDALKSNKLEHAYKHKYSERRTEIVYDQYDTEIVRNFTKKFLMNLDLLWQQLDLPKQ